MMARGNDWCILRTGAARTLKLSDTLNAGGIEAWTPRRTVKREAPGNRRRLVIGQRKVMLEVDVPILPGFVFARSGALDDVMRAAALPFGPYPSFTVLQVGGRVPMISERSVEGLRVAEAEASTAIAAERYAETRDEERRARVKRLGTERARLKALRQERKAFDEGDAVTVAGQASMAGMVGTIVEGRGTSARIHFGGALTMKVEAWRVVSAGVQSGNTLTRDAA